MALNDVGDQLYTYIHYTRKYLGIILPVTCMHVVSNRYNDSKGARVHTSS
jgi:hypothetical protein